MGYQDTFNTLRKIVTSDGSTEEQRAAARTALDKLFSDEITGILDEMDARGDRYQKLTAQLRGVADKIKANQITDAMAEMDKTITDIDEAAAGD